MYVSNGSGFAVPAYTRNASTKETNQRRSGDERREISSVENTTTVYDASDDDNELALR